jgi:DNA-binding winged helix-turn-helix (wHTH) protein
VPQNNEGSRTRVEGFRLGEWRVDPAAGELSDDTCVVRLRPKVMELLVSLAARPGEVLAKQELLDAVWPDVVVAETSLSVTVAQLRKALGDDPARPTFVETIPRRGYRLIGPFTPSPGGRTAPNSSASRFWLIGEDLEFVLSQGENIVGRAPDADVRIVMPKVSRRHARIVVSDDSSVVEDLGSKNGTFIGDTPVDRPTPLSHGDMLRLGNLAAVLRVVILETGSTVSELSKESHTTRPTQNND